MSVIVLASTKGAPGVSTAALALALGWGTPVVLVEADPAGGDVAAGLFRGAFPAGTGVDALATIARRRPPSADELTAQLVGLDTDGRARVLPAASDPGQVAGVWPALLPVLAQNDGDVLIDAGRLAQQGEATALLATADLLLLVLRPTLAEVVRATARLAALRRGDTAGAGPGQVGLLLVGDRPYSSGEVAAAAGATVLGSLPVDPRSADVLAGRSGSPRGLDRRPLLTAACRAAAQIRTAAQDPSRSPGLPGRHVVPVGVRS